MKKYWLFLRQTIIIAVVFAFLAVSFGISVLHQQAQHHTETNILSDKFNKSDSITRAIRNKTKDFVRVRLNSLADRETVGKLGTIVEDYGSFVVLAKNESANLSDSKLDFQDLDTNINLPSGKFEPLNDSRSRLIKNSDAKNYYIVQFGAIATDEWLKSLESAGAEVVQYIPSQAFFVYADGEAIERIASHSRVRWVGNYAAEDKISPELIDFTRRIQSPTAMFDVAVFARADLAEVSNSLANSVQGKILNIIKLPNNFFNVIRVEAPVSEISKIAQMPDVVRIDQYEKPTREDERAAQIVAGNYTGTTTLAPAGYNPLSQFGVNGQNVTISVVDDGVSIPGNGGFYITSANTLNGPMRGAAAGATGGHGHINASIIAGDAPFSVLDPTGYNYSLGVAPKSNIINIPFLTDSYTGTEANTLNDTVVTNGSNGVKGYISNNSWGNGTNSNSYDSYAAQYDGYVQDASSAATIEPICVVFSAGNSGTSGLTRPKVAKNVIAVANSENLRTEISFGANNIDDISGTSSRGLASDGRIKPDITAPGTVVTGSRAGNGSSVSGSVDANHSWSSGTSHAAPQVAGAAALFTQYWKNTHAGANPSPALIKAAIINTAQEMNGVGSTAVRPNGAEGWGRINMKYMLNTGVPTAYINQELAFENAGTGYGFIGKIADTTKPTLVSLVWTDPPGVGNPALVNNLDLLVNIGGTIYKGNVFTNGISTTGGTSDTLNNVENVYLPAGIPAGTTFVISVGALAINGNGILGNADMTDQHFALVAYNFSDFVGRNKESDFDGDGKSDIAVFRPSNGAWYILRSSDNTVSAVQFGASGDTITPGDFDGDGKTDAAVFRSSSGTWYVQGSTQGFIASQFGTNGDIPTAGDYDNDGKTDISVFRPSNGTWYRINSTTNSVASVQFGTSGDKPVPADYDGDGKIDIAVFRPSSGTWYLSQTTSGITGVQFGDANDKPAPGDYDGDGKADVAVYRNGLWYRLGSTQGFSAFSFGASTDIVAPGDYDGDRKADLTVFRPATGFWYRTNSSNSAVNSTQFGANGDIPIAAGYVPAQ